MTSLNRVPANIGRRVPLDVEPTGGVFVVQPSTQLISARANEPRQWLVTLMQAVTSRSGVTPWLSNWDGTAVPFPIAAPNVFTAPEFPFDTEALQVKLRWGAGGVAFETRFDYPLVGATFGVTADLVDVNVGFRGAAPTFADALDVPVVGAFMVPGVAADPSPLRWFDVESGPLNSGYTAVARWSVKPWARRVRVELFGAASTGNGVDIIFTDRNGTIVSQLRTACPLAQVFDVPAQAAILEVSHNEAANIVARVEWYIGLV